MKQNHPIFRGIATALITPTTPTGIDYDRFGRLIDWQIQQGINALVICGTTGESSTLTDAEHRRAIAFACERVNGRVPVIAGTGSNNTAETIAFTEEVAQIPGIDYALVVVPPYNKPNQRSMIAHFTAVADQVHIPVVIYNIPGRTGVKMEVSTILQLAQHPNIAGIKQCASLEEIEEIVSGRPVDFAVFTGEDAQALTARILGADGVISVASHLYTPRMREMYDELYAGNFALAGSLQRWLTPRMKALFMFPSPSPVKAALAAMGYQVGGLRLPLVALKDEEKEELATALKLPKDALAGQLTRDILEGD